MNPWRSPKLIDRYANTKHTYSWPRITAMNGDGKTKYDHDHDNDGHELAACSVSLASDRT